RACACARTTAARSSPPYSRTIARHTTQLSASTVAAGRGSERRGLSVLRSGRRRRSFSFRSRRGASNEHSCFSQRHRARNPDDPLASVVVAPASPAQFHFRLAAVLALHAWDALPG